MIDGSRVVVNWRSLEISIDDCLVGLDEDQFDRLDGSLDPITIHPDDR